jgi:hypothetical protein
VTAVAQLRDLVVALPEVHESTHFRLPAYRVRDAVFVVVQSDDHVVIHVDPATAADAAAAHPAVEQTFRGSTPVGIRVHLPGLEPEDLQGFLAAAWRHRAPKALRTQHQV